MGRGRGEEKLGARGRGEAGEGREEWGVLLEGFLGEVLLKRGGGEGGAGRDGRVGGGGGGHGLGREGREGRKGLGGAGPFLSR